MRRPINIIIPYGSSRSLPGFVLHPQPVGANDDQNYIACGDLAVQVRYEVDPGGDVVDIHKKIFSPKCLGQPIVNPTCRGGRNLRGGS